MDVIFGSVGVVPAAAIVVFEVDKLFLGNFYHIAVCVTDSARFPVESHCPFTVCVANLVADAKSDRFCEFTRCLRLICRTAVAALKGSFDFGMFPLSVVIISDTPTV